MNYLNFDIDSRMYYVIPIIVVLSDLFVHFMVRVVIWSIAKCEISQEVRETELFTEQKNFSMSYLSEYIVEFKKEYTFWMKVKKIVPIIKVIWWIIYLLLPIWFGYNKLVIPHIMIYVQLLANAVFTIAVQDRNRNTKYDRIRIERATRTITGATTVDEEQIDIQNNKTMAVLSYIGFLVIIPIIAAKNSKFARFHANQGLNLFTDIICAVGIYFGLRTQAAGTLDTVFNIVGILILVVIAAFTIIGINNACKGRFKELPLIGHTVMLNDL